MDSSNNSPYLEHSGKCVDQYMLDCYEIHLDGWLNPCWSEWLDGLEIKHMDNSTTTISVQVADQSALYGLLLKIRDLNMKLLLEKKL